MSKIILDLCGGTGAWSKPYRDAGYDVRLVTLPDNDVRNAEFEFGGLIFDTMRVRADQVHGILAAPPCTEFSLAKGSRPRDFEAGLDVVNACLLIIWRCRTHGNLKFWAMENPRGFLRQFLGIPPWTFEQWQFGAQAVKPTDLWGYYNAPKPTVAERPADLVTKYPNGRTNSKTWTGANCLPEYAHLNLGRAALRAITPAGFAEAFFKANR